MLAIAATKSGGESNFSRLGRYLSETIADRSADLDHDGQTSLLEAWLQAAKKVADFYDSEGRLATEHSLLDDNGDGLGTPGRLVSRPAGGENLERPRPARRAASTPNPLLPSASERELRPELRAARDAIERELAEWRRRKPTSPPSECEAKLEEILVRLARVYSGLPDEAP